MRAATRLLALLLVVSIVAACGGGGDDDGTSADAASSETETETESESESTETEAFPVTIEHKYGETTIDEAPARIVTVGLTEQDALLALGVVPVATTEWFGGYPGSVWPWAQDELEEIGAEAPESLGESGAINFERVAATQPDLILAVYSGVTDEDYEKLSAIAPTVAQPGEYVDYGVPWEELTVTVGRAVGKEAEAEAIVADVEAAFATAVDAHPEFDGAEAVATTPEEGSVWVYAEEDVRGRFLTDLGFEVPAWVGEISGDEFGGSLSLEQLDKLDVDAIVWLDALAAEVGDKFPGPIYGALPVHTEGREVHLSSFDDPLGGATSFVTVLSLPYLLDGIVPMLAAAVDGDPATT
jgi:iron complex transport system substrate-binding protein